MRKETALQRSIRAYLTHKGLRSVAVPNGATLSGDRTKRAIQMRNLKLDGLCPGFPDLIVFGPNRIGFIEVKLEGEYATDKQMEVEDWLTAWGQQYAVCRSIEDVEETLGKWGWNKAASPCACSGNVLKEAGRNGVSAPPGPDHNDGIASHG